MLVEQGTVVEIGNSELLVQVINQSTCGRCAAQKGCGQGVLAKYLSGTQFVRVALKHRPASDFQVGEQIELGIEESAMLRAAFLAYLVPLLLLVAGASIGNQFSEPFAILLGLAGLIIGGIYVRKQSLKKVDDPRYAPVVVDDRAIVKIVPGEPA